METNNLIIVGSGPSGLTAGIYAGRAKLDPIIITGKTLGGVVAKLKNIENYPGFANPIDGKTLISNMKEQAINSGAKIVNDVIKDFYVLKDKKILIGESGTQYNTKAVIFATGLNQSKSTIKNINDFLGKGVSTCTTCDGPFYKNKTIAVYGNSKDIEEDILYLSKITSKIIFITENKDFKFKNKNLNNNNIQILDNTTITEAKGDSLKGLETLLITNNLTKEKQELNIDGFFYINNYENNMLLLQDKISTTKNGLVITSDNSFMTNIDGVFVAGDIKEGSTKQIVTACASGAEVVYEVKKWISKN